MIAVSADNTSLPTDFTNHLCNAQKCVARAHVTPIHTRMRSIRKSITFLRSCSCSQRTFFRSTLGPRSVLKMLHVSQFSYSTNFRYTWTFTFLHYRHKRCYNDYINIIRNWFRLNDYRLPNSLFPTRSLVVLIWLYLHSLYSNNSFNAVYGLKINLNTVW